MVRIDNKLILNFYELKKAILKESEDSKLKLNYFAELIFKNLGN